MAMTWWRCKHGAPFNPKWRAVAVRAGDDIRPGDVWAVYTALCDRASQAAVRGSVDGFNVEDISAGLGYAAPVVQKIVKALTDKGLVENLRLTGWQKHQPKQEDDGAAERKRKSRKRHGSSRPVTGGRKRSRNVTAGHDASREVTTDKTRQDKIKTLNESDSESNSESQLGARKKITHTDPQEKKRGTQWPANAVVSSEWIADGAVARAKRNMRAIDLDLEAERFAYFWSSATGQMSFKRNWRLTWLKWVLDDSKQRSGKPSGGSNVFGNLADSFREAEGKNR